MKKWQRGVLGAVMAWLVVAAAVAFVWIAACHPMCFFWIMMAMIVVGITALGWIGGTDVVDDETYPDISL